jgi:formylmethanofuran dehydrogenase subunit E
MELIGTSDPHEMIVVAENDRCIADALQVITGTRLGRRSFKLRDYGKMAATFYNTETEKAFRIWVSGDVTGGRDYHSLSEAEKKMAIKKALASDSDKVLSSRPVKVRFSPNEMPGRPKVRIDCDRCGEFVMDAKHLVINGKKLCLSCAEGAYYKDAR